MVVVNAYFSLFEGTASRVLAGGNCWGYQHYLGERLFQERRIRAQRFACGVRLDAGNQGPIDQGLLCEGVM